MRKSISQNANGLQLAFNFAELATLPVTDLAEVSITITTITEPAQQEYWWSNLEYQKIPRKSGIYAIVNTLNRHFYIGSAVSLYARKSIHFSNLRKNKHKNNHLQSAYNLYGSDTFLFVVVEHVDRAEALIEREQYYIDNLRPEYNIARIAGSTLGIKCLEETKTKISEANKGKHAHNRGKHHSEETKARLSELRKGKPMSEATKVKISETSKGRTHSEETKAKIGEANKSRKGKPAPNKGKPHSEATKVKISEAMKGKPAHNRGRTSSEETRAKQSEAMKGHTHSEETKTRMSKSHMGKTSPNKGKTIPESQKAKISAALKGRTLSEKTRENISKGQKGKKMSPESIAKREGTKRAKRAIDPTYGKNFSHD